MKIYPTGSCVTFSILCVLCLQAPVEAQSSRDRRRDEKPPTEQELQSRLEKAEELLVTEYRDVANEYYKAGDKEKSMAMLRRLKQLNPKMKGLEEQIGIISEELLQENPNDFEIDTRKSWEPIGVVAEGKTFRLTASGEFKITIITSVNVDGLVPDEKSPDYSPTAPLGCLMGVIIPTEGKPGRALGRPFPVKSQLEMTPKKTGTLYVKVNVPPGTRCVGKFKVHVSGYIETGRK